MKNVLKLQRKEIAGLEVKDTGILLHAVMERYFSLKDCADYDEAKIERTVSDIFIDEVKKNSDYSFLLDEKDTRADVATACRPGGLRRKKIL